MNLDISKTIEAKSDQLNAEDFLTGSQTLTVTGVSKGTPDQPVNVHVAEYPKRAYKPSKSMRRVLAAGWGADADKWAGKHLTLFREPSIKFGGQEIGGIRISHMEGLTEPLTVWLMVTRGKKERYTVQPLTAPAPAQSDPLVEFMERAQSAASVDDLNAIYHDAAKIGEPPAELMDALNRRKQELTSSE